jgi:hypothetical protein
MSDENTTDPEDNNTVEEAPEATEPETAETDTDEQ